MTSNYEHAGNIKKQKTLQRNRNVGKELGDTMKNQVIMLGLKNTMTEVRGSVDGLSGRREGIEEILTESEPRTTEITQTEQKENRLKIKNKEPQRSSRL